jgi:ADP-dependent NAD(P)H-hydrate dehydratase / NAD(P)H-hydrate epimerase
MKLFLADQIRAADAFTIKNEPISSVDLMERAAEGLVQWIIKRYSTDRRFILFAGPGNNGGDGWALARLLWKKGFSNIQLYSLKISNSLSHDLEHNRKRLVRESQVPVTELSKGKDFPKLRARDVIIDALFGSGLSRPLKGLVGELIQYLNSQEGIEIISIDLPSGLFPEDNSKNTIENIIHATFTLTFQFPKLAFFFAENEIFAGSWKVIPIGIHQNFINKEPTDFNFCEVDEMAQLLKPRRKFSHKGTFGHGLMIAGSYGMMGAAVLATKAAVHAGAGLITAHVPRMGVDIMQTAVPESLLSIDESDILFTEHRSIEKYTAIAIGPGLNQKPNTRKALIGLLSDISVPCVIDADGLNLLSAIDNWKMLIPENCILTPHPKEFERLFGKFEDSYSRLMLQKEFSQIKKCVIILKGAHTCVTSPDGKAWFNTTGNPGMSTGGSGDVLTGIILGLLTQGYSTFDASLLGVFIHGLAGDIAVKETSLYGLAASSIINTLGKAFRILEEKKQNYEKN